MATKRTVELKNMSVEELENQLTEVRGDYSKMRFDHRVKGLENPMELVKVRKEIARLNTELRVRELAAMTPDMVGRKRSRITLRRKLAKIHK
jgi:large subunit ribosomal protein L29